MQTEDNKVRVIDLATGHELWKPQKATDDYVMALALSPDGKILASGAGHADSVIRLWDVASGRELGKLEGHRAGIDQLLFLPDGHTLASASRDQTIRLWDVTDPANGRGTEHTPGTPELGARARTAAGQHHAGERVEDRTVCFWNTAAPRQKKSNSRCRYPSVPGALLRTANPWWLWYDRRRRINLRVARWSSETDFQNDEPLLEMGTNIVDEACFSGDGRWLATSYLEARSGSGICKLAAKRANSMRL